MDSSSSTRQFLQDYLSPSFLATLRSSLSSLESSKETLTDTYHEAQVHFEDLSRSGQAAWNKGSSFFNSTASRLGFPSSESGTSFPSKEYSVVGKNGVLGTHALPSKELAPSSGPSHPTLLTSDSKKLPGKSNSETVNSRVEGSPQVPLTPLEGRHGQGASEFSSIASDLNSVQVSDLREVPVVKRETERSSLSTTLPASEVGTATVLCPPVPLSFSSSSSPGVSKVSHPTSPTPIPIIQMVAPSQEIKVTSTKSNQKVHSSQPWIEDGSEIIGSLDSLVSLVSHHPDMKPLKAQLALLKNQVSSFLALLPSSFPTSLPPQESYDLNQVSSVVELALEDQSSLFQEKWSSLQDTFESKWKSLFSEYTRLLKEVESLERNSVQTASQFKLETKEALSRQKDNLERFYTRQVKTMVDKERNGRLAQLDGLALSLKELEKASSSLGENYIKSQSVLNGLTALEVLSLSLSESHLSPTPGQGVMEFNSKYSSFTTPLSSSSASSSSTVSLPISSFPSSPPSTRSNLEASMDSLGRILKNLPPGSQQDFLYSVLYQGILVPNFQKQGCFFPSITDLNFRFRTVSSRVRGVLFMIPPTIRSFSLPLESEQEKNLSISSRPSSSSSLPPLPIPSNILRNPSTSESVLSMSTPFSWLPSSSLLSYLVSRCLTPFLTIKRHEQIHGPGWEGSDSSSILSRADFHLNNGNLESAVREMNSLTGWSQILSQDWLSLARQRVEVLNALEVLQTHFKLMGLNQV